MAALCARPRRGPLVWPRASASGNWGSGLPSEGSEVSACSFGHWNPCGPFCCEGQSHVDLCKGWPASWEGLQVPNFKQGLNSCREVSPEFGSLIYHSETFTIKGSKGLS